jgi:hypothetical protein
MPPMPLLLPLLWVALATPADAAVYKCAGDKGGVVYQDSACAPGKELHLEFDPATVNVVPSTPVPGPAAAKPTRVPDATARIRSGSAAERRNLHIGMSETEVVLKVGRPDLEDKGNTRSGPRWTYLPTAGDPKTQTTLTFAGGKVASVERKPVP